MVFGLVGHVVSIGDFEGGDDAVELVVRDGVIGSSLIDLEEAVVQVIRVGDPGLRQEVGEGGRVAGDRAHLGANCLDLLGMGLGERVDGVQGLRDHVVVDGVGTAEDAEQEDPCRADVERFDDFRDIHFVCSFLFWGGG